MFGFPIDHALLNVVFHHATQAEICGLVLFLTSARDGSATSSGATECTWTNSVNIVQLCNFHGKAMRRHHCPRGPLSSPSPRYRAHSSSGTSVSSHTPIRMPRR